MIQAQQRGTAATGMAGSGGRASGERAAVSRGAGARGAAGHGAAQRGVADLSARERDVAAIAARDRNPVELSELESSFVGQIATAVWIGRLTDAAAREALLSYAIAVHLCHGVLVVRLQAALVAEYRHWRERQDLAS